LQIPSLESLVGTATASTSSDTITQLPSATVTACLIRQRLINK